MSVDTVTLFLAILAVVAEVTVVVAVVVWVGSRWSTGARRAREALRRTIGPDALLLALGVAAVAMAGSLYLSEVANFPPCRLCWYQRIAMYPLVPILVIAAIRRDVAIRPYVVTLAVTGGAISTYHIVLERYPSLESGVCEVTNPCTLIWVRRFGYLTIPTMALSAFAAIVVLALAARPRSEPA